MLLEIIYLTEQWDLLHLFLQRDPAQCVSDMLEEYGTDSRLRHCAEHYHDAMRELEELEALLRNADHSLVCKPCAARGNIRLMACKAKLSFEEDPRTYRMFCDYIWNLTKKPCSFVLRYLSIDMPQLSSGEKALQNICAWLHLASARKGGAFGKGKTILLLLDEVDLYMHPEWQRRFLEFLSEELHNQFEDRDVQIVLTTHSPLVLSDIPSGNIIYLKNADCRCMIEDHGDFRESFGASIPALLKNSFFMTETMGGFAKKKITEVVQVLEAFRKDPDDPILREECFVRGRIIDIIGEPVIRHKLQARYQELMCTESKPEDPSHAVREWLNMADSQQKKAMKRKILEMLSEIDDI